MTSFLHKYSAENFKPEVNTSGVARLKNRDFRVVDAVDRVEMDLLRSPCAEAALWVLRCLRLATCCNFDCLVSYLKGRLCFVPSGRSWNTCF